MLDERVRDRIIAETRGNPLALLELPRGLTATQLAGGFGLLGAHARCRDGSRRASFGGSRRCPRTRGVCCWSRRPSRSAIRCCCWRACRATRASRPRAVDAATDGLLAFGERVTFRHPLVRSAVYRSAAVQERRAVHLALAEATDRDVDPDRRAWHLAAAAAGPDEQVALELERSAGRAQARGGLAAAAAFLQRAVALTATRRRRADRALAAAEASLQAGAFDVARRLLATAEVGPLDELQRARLDLLRAEAAYSESRGSEAPALLLRAAKTLDPLDPKLARETYLDAWSAALFAGRLASAAACTRCRATPWPGRRRRPTRRVRPICCCDGFSLRVHRRARRRGAGARAGGERLRRQRGHRSRRSCAGGGWRPRPP